MTDELTAEEQTALEAMEKNEPIELAEPDKEPEKEPETEQVEAKVSEEKAEESGKEPEFKSSRSDEKPPEGFVPHQAMHAERVKRQEAERRLQEYEAAQAKPEAKAPEYADPLIDPAGHRQWAEFQAAKSQQSIEQMQQQQQQQIETQQRVQEASRFEQEFMAKTPDYNDAMQFLQTSRVSELRAQGLGDQEINKQIMTDANSIFDAAKTAGMNPAELLYMQSKSRGFAAPAPAPEGPSEAEKVVALAAAQKSTEGVSTTGAPQEGKLTVAALADMSEQELSKLSDEDFKRVMGG